MASWKMRAYLGGGGHVRVALSLLLLALATAAGLLGDDLVPLGLRSILLERLEDVLLCLFHCLAAGLARAPAAPKKWGEAMFFSFLVLFGGEGTGAVSRKEPKKKKDRHSRGDGLHMAGLQEAQVADHGLANLHLFGLRVLLQVLGDLVTPAGQG